MLEARGRPTVAVVAFVQASAPRLQNPAGGTVAPWARGDVTRRRQYRPQGFEVEVGIGTSPRVAARTVLASWGAVVRTVGGAVGAVKRGLCKGRARVVQESKRGAVQVLQALQGLVST